MRNLVGTWRIAAPQSEGNPEPFTALHTFFADGNWSEINSLRDVNRGVWTAAGSSYLLAFEGYTFAADGTSNGNFRARATVELEDDDHLTAGWDLDMFDLQGRVTQRAFYGTFTGTRMVPVPV